MGGIWGSREYFNDALIEIAGYKAGVILTDAELFDIMREDPEVSRILDPAGPGGGRIHSSGFEEAVTLLLYKLGNIASPDNISITIELFHKYSKAGQGELYQSVMEAYLPFMEAELVKEQPTGKIDPTPLITAMYDKHGMPGADLVLELISGVNRDLHRSAWGSIRNIDWKDSVELRDLFASAGLETQHGKFIDQRYIDYLAQNFDKIDSMHWRKFEAFTAEFFDREGYKVVLGPGSNDDGVDLRVYPLEADPDLPPMIIVQCKRQKAKIEKALVKSVYADVLHENADSGLIVTTSTLAPGAETTRTARNYPIEAADRDTLRDWIDKLRSI